MFREDTNHTGLLFLGESRSLDIKRKDCRNSKLDLIDTDVLQCKHYMPIIQGRHALYTFTKENKSILIREIGGTT